MEAHAPKRYSGVSDTTQKGETKMKQETKARIRVVGRILFLVYLLALVYFLFFAEEYGRRNFFELDYRYNLVPFQEIRRFWIYREKVGFLAAFLCDRILTSGQQSDAVKGIPLIAELVKRADGRIIIMPGCGVRENNIGKIEAETGAKEFHTSARSIVYSKMEYRNENVPMGSSIVSSEFETVQTDREKVKAYI